MFSKTIEIRPGYKRHRTLLYDQFGSMIAICSTQGSVNSSSSLLPWPQTSWSQEVAGDCCSRKASSSSVHTKCTLLWASCEPVLDVRYPALDLPDVEVCIFGKVSTNWGMGIAQRAVKGSSTQTDHHGNEAKQEEKKARVPTANICVETKTGGRVWVWKSSIIHFNNVVNFQY